MKISNKTKNFLTSLKLFFVGDINARFLEDDKINKCNIEDLNEKAVSSALKNINNQIAKAELELKKNEDTESKRMVLKLKSQKLAKLKEEAECRKLEITSIKKAEKLQLAGDIEQKSLENFKKKERIKALALKEAEENINQVRKEKEKLLEDKGKRIKKTFNNVYLRGRSVLYDLQATANDRIRKYRYAFLLQTMTLLVCVIGLIYIGSASKFVPYIVHEGAEGNVIGVNAAVQAPAITKKLERYFVQEFLINLRSVSGDNIIEKKQMAEVMASVDESQHSNALGIVKQYLTDNNPYILNHKYTVAVNVVDMIPLTANTYEINWNETKRSSSGRTISIEHFVGQLGYKIGSVSPQNIQYNPFGIYIDNISSSKIVT